MNADRMHPRRATRLLREAAEGDRRAQAVLASLAAGLLVGVMYLPLIFLRYGLYDDYGKGADPLRTLWSFSVSDGRPVGGVLYVVGFGLTRQISGFGILRAVCIILLAVGAAGLTRILAARTERIWLSAAVAVAAHATIGVQIVAAWGATLYVAPFAAISAGVGGWLLWEHRSVPRRGVIGCLLIITGLSTYQPAGMACIAVVLVLFVTDVRIGVDLVKYLAVTLAWLAAAFVSSLVVWRVCQAFVPKVGDRGDLVSDVGAKWTWLTDVVLGRALRPFTIFLSSWLWIAVIVALILCAPLSAGTRVTTWAFKSIVTTVGLVATYISNLAVSENWASARSLWVTMIAVVAVAGVGVIRCIEFISRRGPAIIRQSALVAVAAGVGFAALNATQHTIDYIAAPNAAELRAAQAQMRSAVLLRPPMIVLKPSHYSDTIAPGISYDEFGYPASAAEWAVLPMVLSVALQYGYTGEIKVSQDPSTVDQPPGTIVIDFSAILKGLDTGDASGR